MDLSKDKIRLLVIGILVISNIIAWQHISFLLCPYLDVTFLDVGQGDSIFIQTPSKNQILIDGGPNSQVLERLGNQIPFFDRTLDLIVLTHPEKDHMAGLLDVLKVYRVENILWSGVVRETKDFKEWQRLIEGEGSNMIIAKAGKRIILDSGIYLDILNPSVSLEGELINDSNPTSVVVRLVNRNMSFLFTGDIDQKVEKALENKEVKADILKVAHHGSKYSSSEGFLRAVSPRIAIIEVGDNSYGQPAQEVLQRLENSGINSFNTKDSGDIKIITDGNNLKILTNK